MRRTELWIEVEINSDILFTTGSAALDASARNTLGTLAEFHALPRNGRAHRALSDAEVTAELLLRIQRDLRQRHGVDAPDHDFLQALQQCSKATLPRFWQRQAGATA